MRVRLSIGLTLVAAIAALAFAASTVFGNDSPADLRPGYATVQVDLGPAAAPVTARKAGDHKPSSKPKVVYLTGKGTVNTDTATGGTGPYIDFKLNVAKNICPRVINGLVNPKTVDLFQQGSFVKRGIYHVLMGLDDNAAGTPTSIRYQSQVICLKGVR